MQSIFREELEQELVGAFLPPVGFFIEVGAYHPSELSQTLHLEQRGWDGMLVEPVPEQAERLKAARKARVIQAACGSPEQHGCMMSLYLSGGRSSLVLEHGPAINVMVWTLASLLEDAKIRNVDFLSVDVEGAEIAVLEGFPFYRCRPKLILIEDFADDLSRHRFMRKHNYKRVRRTGNNSWYVPKESHFPLSLFGRWQLLRKYYLALPVRWLKNTIRG